jgi:glucokinase
LVAGVDIGGTNQSVAVASSDGQVLALRRRRLRPGGAAQDVIANVLALLDESLVEARSQIGAQNDVRLCGIGVGFGGPVDVQRGTVIRSHHVPGWDSYPLRDDLAQRVGAPVVVDNDANAAALGEARFGAGQGHASVLYVNVGTGIGGGVVLNGRLYHGANGMAGEIGHVTVTPDGPPCDCGKRGCLEAVASGRSLGRRAREAAQREPESARLLVEAAGDDAAKIEGPHVFTAAAAGDLLATRLIEETAGYLGLALGNVANVLDPSIVVIGGGLSETGEALFTPLRAAVRRHLLPELPAPPVVPAALGYEAGVIGAVSLALDEL